MILLEAILTYKQISDVSKVEAPIQAEVYHLQSSEYQPFFIPYDYAIIANSCLSVWALLSKSVKEIE